MQYTPLVVRRNDQIPGPNVQVIAADGAMLGVLPIEDALARTREAGLDLVEVNPERVPRVCKIMDISRFSYAEAKAKADARKRRRDRQED